MVSTGACEFYWKGDEFLHPRSCSVILEECQRKKTKNYKWNHFPQEFFLLFRHAYLLSLFHKNIPNKIHKLPSVLSRKLFRDFTDIVNFSHDTYASWSPLFICFGVNPHEAPRIEDSNQIKT